MTNRKILDAKKVSRSKDNEKIRSIKDAIKKLRARGWDNKRIASAIHCDEAFVRKLSM